MTQFIGVSPSSLLGAPTKAYYRVTFDINGGGYFFGAGENKLNYIYDHMQDSRALAPLTPNPVTGGDEVMTVDAWTIADSASLSVADAVRRLDMMAGGSGMSADLTGASYVRSIQKLSGIGDVTGGATDRDQTTADANNANDENSFTHKLNLFFSGLGNFATLGMFAVIAYAAITLSAGLPLLPRRRNRG